LSFGVALVAISVLATVVLSGLRLRRVLFDENLDGQVFLQGVEKLLAQGKREAVLAACAEVPGTAVAEIVKAAVEAAPEGREAIERAVDEAQLDWLPERESARGLLGTLVRVDAAIGMLGGAIELRAALALELETLPLGPVVLTLGGGILGLMIALYARALASRTITRISDEATRAARRLPDLLAPAP
jgi:hypothetical protein